MVSSPILIVALLGYAVAVAGWWLRHVLISLVRPLDLYVPAGDPAQVDARVSVVVPARNERPRIAGCIETLLQQGAIIQEIIVVDDRSEDGTGAVAMRAADGDSRLRVVRIDALPPGWAGKAHACQTGANAACGEWLLFADADCRFRPGGVAGTLAYAGRRKADLLTLWLAADHRSFWEHVLIPLCGALILYWFPPLRANRPGSPVAYANGQFILIRRNAYIRMGGHTCSRDTVIEDIPLAQHAKRLGLRLVTALGPDIAAVRMYAGFREIWNGWTRIFIGALQGRWRLLVSMASLLGGSLLPSVGAPVAIFWIARHGFPQVVTWQALSLLLVLHFVAVYSVSFRLWGLCRCARRYLGLYPLSVLFVMAILARAFWWLHIGRPIFWRGTVTGRRTC